METRSFTIRFAKIKAKKRKDCEKIQGGNLVQLALASGNATFLSSLFPGTQFLNGLSQSVNKIN